MIACLTISVGQITATSTTGRSSDLILNEFLAANGSGLTDEDGDYSDWIEIYNQSNQRVNLAGWSLTDDPSQPVKWPFPSITLGGGEYLVVFASGKNRGLVEPGAALHTNFRLNKAGAFLGLHSVLEGRFMDEVEPQFPQQVRNVSYGRYGDGTTYGYLATPSPGGPNNESLVWQGIASPVEFSAKHGLYDTPLSVELTSKSVDAVVVYTTDGSEPTESNGSRYDNPVSIDTTTLLRAAAFQPGYLPSEVGTQSYIFPEDVLSQPAAPDGFPQSWGAHLTESQGRLTVAPIAADYEMDPRLVGDPQHRAAIKESLVSLPTVSLVLEQQSFNDLYVYTEKTGRDAERPVSFEFFSSDRAFQVNAGLRLHSDVTSRTTSPKRSFRLSFRDDYGPTKLRYPLFPDSPIEEFDSLILKAAIADTVDTSDPADGLSAYARNEWIRASQVAMSGLGAHGTFVHLYINGLYWGLYSLVERPDSSFMAAYVGGQEDEWFVADELGPIGNNAASRHKVLDYLFTAISAAPTLNQEFSPQAALPDAFESVVSYIDPAQLSDFIILGWYAEAQDWPQSKWFAAVNLRDLPGRGKFLVGDEKSASDQELPQREVADILAKVLLQNPDARMVLADRLFKHLFNDGALADHNAQARWSAVLSEIDGAIDAEAARWSDAVGQQPFSYDDWLTSSDRERAKMEQNAAEIAALARDAGLYPALDPPLFSRDGGLVEAGFLLELTLPESATGAHAYFTTDGLDPRLPVSGTVAPSAQAYTTPISLTANTLIKARLFDGETWSALNEAAFSAVEQDNKVRLTEIMYNPLAGDDYEFIELKNTGRSDVALANASFVEGVLFLFPPDTPPLAPGAHVVLVRNPDAFSERYPELPISGVYDGSLSNKGERILLVDANLQTIVDVTYDDANGWPISPDGRGDSLVLVKPDGYPNSPSSWRASRNLHGSPNAND